MDYQLVLQFPTQSEDDASRLLTFEDDLIETLKDAAEVEGHEAGEHEMNFFITTNDAEETFDQLRPLLEEKGLLATATAASRHVDDDDYIVIWPEDAREKKLLIA
jgi:hypothetical protein